MFFSEKEDEGHDTCMHNPHRWIFDADPHNLLALARTPSLRIVITKIMEHLYS
jgi:hypothetical protein